MKRKIQNFPFLITVLVSAIVTNILFSVQLYNSKYVELRDSADFVDPNNHGKVDAAFFPIIIFTFDVSAKLPFLFVSLYCFVL